MSSPREGKKEVDEAKIGEFKDCVSRKNYSRAIELLNGGVDINTPLSLIGRDSTILDVACYMDQPEIVEQLLMHGADIKTRFSSDCNSAIHYAAASSAACLKLIIDNKGDIDLPGYNGETPLMEAARFHNPNCVKLLLEHKADPSKVNNVGDNALDMAGEDEAVISLLQDATSSKKLRR